MKPRVMDHYVAMWLHLGDSKTSISDAEMDALRDEYVRIHPLRICREDVGRGGFAAVCGLHMMTDDIPLAAAFCA